MSGKATQGDQSSATERLLKDIERYDALVDACYDKADRAWADWSNFTRYAHDYMAKANRARSKLREQEGSGS